MHPRYQTVELGSSEGFTSLKKDNSWAGKSTTIQATRGELYAAKGEKVTGI